VGGSIGVRVIKGAIQYSAEVAMFWVGYQPVRVIAAVGYPIYNGKLGLSFQLNKPTSFRSTTSLNIRTCLQILTAQVNNTVLERSRGSDTHFKSKINPANQNSSSLEKNREGYFYPRAHKQWVIRTSNTPIFFNLSSVEVGAFMCVRAPILRMDSIVESINILN
jgi:hypothetical protein